MGGAPGRDRAGRLPGEVPEYAQYLSTVAGENKDQTTAAPCSRLPLTCPLCQTAARLYPRALALYRTRPLLRSFLS